MNAAITVQRTRREKKDDVRKAVVSTVRTLGKSVAGETYEELLGKLLCEIRRTRATPYPIDCKDISLALRWLCAKDIVRIRHFDSLTGARAHCVTLLRA